MTAPPHIAYLYSRYPVVSQTFCDSEMLALEAQGVPLSVASLNPPPNSFRHQRLRDLRAEVHYPPPSEVLKTLQIPGAMQALADEHAEKYPRFKIERARNAAYFARLFERESIDHVHVHFANQATWTALFLKQAGFTFSFTAHAQDFMVDLGSDDLLREMAAAAEFVIAVSDHSRKLLCDVCPASADKIHRIYNGIRTGDFSPNAGCTANRAWVFPTAAPSAAAINPSQDFRKPIRIISIGRLIEFKGFHHLIESVSLLGKMGIHAELDIVGDGPWRERLDSQITRLELGQLVHLRGILSQDQIQRLLADADIFALACCIDARGASDILPTVIMEAMAARLPVVSTRLAGVPEMVAHDSTGILVDPANPPAIADALAHLATDEDRRLRFGLAGRKMCEEKFSIVKSAAGMRILLERVAPHPTGTQSSSKRSNLARAGVLLLLDHWPDEESAAREFAAFLSDRETLALVARGGIDSRQPCPERVEFLADAVVLEAAWKADPTAVALCEAIHATLDGRDGEDFFRAARRAVHTAGIVRKRGIRHVHAARSSDVAWTWLVKKLTGIRASFAIEASPSVPRSFLAAAVADFDFGTTGDAKLNEMTGGKFPDVIGLELRPRRGLFSKSTEAPQVHAAWIDRMTAPVKTPDSKFQDPKS